MCQRSGTITQRLGPVGIVGEVHLPNVVPAVPFGDSDEIVEELTADSLEAWSKMVIHLVPCYSPTPGVALGERRSRPCSIGLLADPRRRHEFRVGRDGEPLPGADPRWIIEQG